MAYSHTKILEPSNRLKFTCPIFNAEVEARVCFKLHELFMIGRPHEKRPGCAACMWAQKCPVQHMIKEQMIAGEERYYSAEPKLGKISAKILEAIRPIIVMSGTLDRYRVSDRERQAIQAATGPVGSKKRMSLEMAEPELPEKKSRVSRSSAAAPDKSDVVLEAARTGDMSLAVTKAAEAVKESATVETAAKPVETSHATSVSKPTPAKGLSLLELARMKKAS